MIKNLEDTFRFELMKENKPFFVHVTITHEIGNDEQFTLKIEKPKLLLLFGFVSVKSLYEAFFIFRINNI